MKKILLLAIIIGGLSLALQPAWAYSPRESDLIKTARNSAVYYVDYNGGRHLFPTESTFFSWYKGSWKNQTVITISENDFLAMPVGKNITIKPGSSLIKFDNSLKMYAVLPNGKICRAPAHYGNYQYNRALTIPSGFETDYYNDNICDITSDQKLPDGTLFRYYGSSDVYYVQNGLRRKVTLTAFDENNFRWESVISDVSWSMNYADGLTIYGREDSIYKPAYSYAYGCNEDWTCNSWGNCSNGYRYRSCWDKNYCGTYKNKPIETETCSTCRENWSCGIWSACAYNRQYRTCYDLNYCGTTYSKPSESQTCTSCQENWSCGDWGACTGIGSNGSQYRSCYDKNYCGTASSKPATARVCALCSETWSCTAWSVCSGQAQYRSCLDTNRCGTANSKPIEYKTCQ